MMEKVNQASSSPQYIDKFVMDSPIHHKLHRFIKSRQLFNLKIVPPCFGETVIHFHNSSYLVCLCPSYGTLSVVDWFSEILF